MYGSIVIILRGIKPPYLPDTVLLFKLKLPLVLLSATMPATNQVPLKSSSIKQSTNFLMKWSIVGSFLLITNGLYLL